VHYTHTNPLSLPYTSSLPPFHPQALQAQGLSDGPSHEELEQMAELEREMEKHEDAESNSAPSSPSGSSAANGGEAAAPRSRATLPEGAMPSRNGKLTSAAADFWFPESRNCPCCKGFKHGCSCRSQGVDTCTHPECIDAELSASVRARVAASASAPASAPPPSGPISHGTPRTLPPSNTWPAASSAPPRGPPPSDESARPCSFFNSPQGCRFGATCRNLHAGPGSPSHGGGGYPPMGGPGPMGYAPRPYGGSPPMGGGPPQGGGDQTCVFFRQGTCKFGASCRFVHA